MNQPHGRSRQLRTLVCIALVVLVCLPACALRGRTYPVTAAASPQAQRFLQQKRIKPKFRDWHIYWEKARQGHTAHIRQQAEQLRAAGFDFSTQTEQIAGVPINRIVPEGTAGSRRLLIFTHSGGYCLGSARYQVAIPVMVATAAGMPVISIDYRLTPEHPYPAALDDALAVYRALLERGQDPASIGWFGASAGGNMTFAITHAIKQAGLPLPGALAGISPWTDLTGAGDSRTTLQDDDPILLDRPNIAIWAKAYYGTFDPRLPTISPVYGSYAGFPPILLQVGTKEVILSDTIRLAWKARRDGADVTLDVWDGMWHIFHERPDLPEARQANREIGEFFRRHLSVPGAAAAP